MVHVERDVILEERRSRVDNEPGAQLGEMTAAALYMNHPYGIPIIGWEHEMRGLTTEDAIAFYRRWYAPNNAILVVAGDVTPEEVRALAETYYGVIPAAELPERRRPSEPAQFASRRITLESARVRQPALWIDYLAPSYRAGENQHAYPLQVLDEILGGGSTSRLYRGLVVEQGVAAGAGSSYSAGALDLTAFRFYVTPRPGTEMAEAEAALRAAIEQVAEAGVTAEEVDTAKRRLRAAAVYARDGLSTGANVLGRALASGQSVADVESWPQRIEAVTVEQVNAAVRALLREESSVTGVLLPEPTT